MRGKGIEREDLAEMGFVGAQHAAAPTKRSVVFGFARRWVRAGGDADRSQTGPYQRWGTLECLGCAATRPYGTGPLEGEGNEEMGTFDPR